MSQCNFEIQFSGDAAGIIAKAEQQVKKINGTFSGNAGGGSIDIPTPMGKIVGNYTISGNTFSMEITDKPMFLPCSMIEDKLKEFIS